MRLSIAPPGTLYANPAPLLVSRQAAFPGLAVAADGNLVAVFSVGQAFDAADMTPVVCRSGDGGATWSEPAPMFPPQDGWPRWSETVKPVALPDGRMLALGYGFARPDPLTPIVDPATRRLLPMRNIAAWSDDAGRSWSPPRAVSAGAALELSGPPIVATGGRLLAAAAPFRLEPGGQEGWLVASDDGGANWRRLSVFYRAAGGHVAPWECRLAEIGPGRIAVLFWAFDARTDRSLDNHLALSGDGGASFAPAIATGIRGQAAGLAPLGDRLLTIHAHREPPTGLIVRVLRIEADAIVIEAEAPILAHHAPASGTGDVAAQFGSLKFGQPSLLPLRGGDFLASWWQIEACQHVIKTARVTLKAE